MLRLISFITGLAIGVLAFVLSGLSFAEILADGPYSSSGYLFTLFLGGLGIGLFGNTRAPLGLLGILIGQYSCLLWLFPPGSASSTAAIGFGFATITTVISLIGSCIGVPLGWGLLWLWRKIRRK